MTRAISLLLLLGAFGFAAAPAQAGLTIPTVERCIEAENLRCYGPPQLRKAYGIDRLAQRGIDGRGTKIAIIMAPSQTLAPDLERFSQIFGLPAPKLTVLRPLGPQRESSDHGEEATLDVQAAHTIAPRAELLFVEVPDASLSGAILQSEPLAKAVDAAIDAGADVISMSFGGVEQRYPAFRAALARARARGVPALTGSGDNGVVFPGQRGIGTSYPATDPNVTAVGGTLLTLTPSGVRELPDVAWGPDASGGASGGGVSKLDAMPSWQRGVGGTRPGGRNYPDVSMSGALSGAFLMVITQSGKQRFLPIAGTSEATPLFAGIVALATQVAGRKLPNVSPALYRLQRSKRGGVVDVVLGNNSYTDAKQRLVRGFLARRGYDLVTGVGTVDAPRFVPALARAAR